MTTMREATAEEFLGIDGDEPRCRLCDYGCGACDAARALAARIDEAAEQLGAALPAVDRARAERALRMTAPQRVVCS
jgi:hypothetical protein